MTEPATSTVFSFDKDNRTTILSADARSLPTLIADILYRDIAEGRLAPASRLGQVELAQRFGVSTTPVREALGILRSLGVLDVNPRRGAVVVKPTVQDVTELYEMRIPLEALAARCAAERFEHHIALRLRGLLEELSSCSDSVRSVQLNHSFHMGIYQVSGRQRLVDCINNLRALSNIYILMSAARLGPSDRDDQEHAAILDACEARDVVAASEAVTQHLEGTFQAVRERLLDLDAGEHPS